MAIQLLEIYESLQAFFETGGDVLYAIFAVTLLMWIFILERMMYFAFTHKQSAKKSRTYWFARQDKSSWFAHQIRQQEVSRITSGLYKSLSLIKTLVAICPLLGLLGTVTGMIEVFDVMALVGTGNARAMASGVSMATIPTMAGMVAALSGLYFTVRLQKRAEKLATLFDDSLSFDKGY